MISLGGWRRHDNFWAMENFSHKPNGLEILCSRVPSTFDTGDQSEILLGRLNIFVYVDALLVLM